MNNAYTLCDEECRHTQPRQSVCLKGSTLRSGLVHLLLTALKAVTKGTTKRGPSPRQVGHHPLHHLVVVVVVVVDQEKKALKLCQFSRKAT